MMDSPTPNIDRLAGDPGHARVLAELRERCGRTIQILLDDQSLEMALLEDAPWKGRWISDGKPGPANDAIVY